MYVCTHVRTRDRIKRIQDVGRYIHSRTDAFGVSRKFENRRGKREKYSRFKLNKFKFKSKTMKRNIPIFHFVFPTLKL